jgi:metal-responsive CopG/Arc/MetJ family transcriptional regulator
MGARGPGARPHRRAPEDVITRMTLSLPLGELDRLYDLVEPAERSRVIRRALARELDALEAAEGENEEQEYAA